MCSVGHIDAFGGINGFLDPATTEIHGKTKKVTLNINK